MSCIVKKRFMEFKRHSNRQMIRGAKVDTVRNHVPSTQLTAVSPSKSSIVVSSIASALDPVYTEVGIISKECTKREYQLRMIVTKIFKTD